MAKNSSSTETLGGRSREAAPKLLEALSEGLHTMAQPLTVLRATLEIASGNASSISHFQHAIDNSLVEVGRVTEAMGFVQELVRIGRDVEAPVAVDLELVAHTLQQDLQRVIEGAGVELAVQVPEGTPIVMGSASRIRQCLFYLMQHMISTCPAGDSIRLAIEAAEDGGLVTLRGERSHAANLGFAHKRNRLHDCDMPSLTLADTLATDQGGRLEWQDDPFAFRLVLPAADAPPASRMKPGRASSPPLVRNAV